MTISIVSSGDGTTGSIQLNGTNVSTFTNSGMPFMRNILINGDMRINQRVTTIAAAANGTYGPDRWKKVDAGNMTQIVESGNFKPSTIYTLSGTNVTTQQITSPASGHWTLPNISITATNVQLEEGSIATPFELRPIGLELIMCQRYYEKSYNDAEAPGTITSAGGYHMTVGAATPWPSTATVQFRVVKRISPTITTYNPFAANSAWGDEGRNQDFSSNISLVNDSSMRIYPAPEIPSTTRHLHIHWVANAEI